MREDRMTAGKPHDPKAKLPPKEKKHLDELLDEALDETFPASDPPAMTEPVPDGKPDADKPRNDKA
jgi:hypothetical protein